MIQHEKTTLNYFNVIFISIINKLNQSRRQVRKKEKSQIFDFTSIFDKNCKHIIQNYKKIRDGFGKKNL